MWARYMGGGDGTHEWGRNAWAGHRQERHVGRIAWGAACMIACRGTAGRIE